MTGQFTQRLLPAPALMSWWSLPSGRFIPTSKVRLVCTKHEALPRWHHELMKHKRNTPPGNADAEKRKKKNFSPSCKLSGNYTAFLIAGWGEAAAGKLTPLHLLCGQRLPWQLLSFTAELSARHLRRAENVFLGTFSNLSNISMFMARRLKASDWGGRVMFAAS